MADLSRYIEQEEEQGSSEEREGEGKENGVPLGPRDKIKVSVQQYQKAGNDHIYDIEVEVNGEAKVIHREYREVLWLHRYLMRKVDLGGYTLPPMPAPPPKSPDPRAAALGDSSKALYGDDTRLPCLAMEVFLQSLADHHFFAENEVVHCYLTSDKLSAFEYLGAGSLWSHITKAFSDYQLSSTQDTDDRFVTFLSHTETISPLLNTAAQNFSQMVASLQSLAYSMAHVSEVVKEWSLWEESRNKGCSGSLNRLRDGLEEEKQLVCVSSLDGRHSLGFTLDFHHCLCEQIKEMLYRRLQKLQVQLTCTQRLDKAKPEKKEAAEAAKDDADHAYQTITEVAWKQVELFKEQRTRTIHSSLVRYAEAHVSHCKQTYMNLAKIKEELENPSTYTLTSELVS